MTRMRKVRTGLRAAAVLAPHLLRNRPRRPSAARSADDRASDRREQDLERIARRLLSADVVSFDLFDTLVTRMLRRPEDVHDLVARRAALEGIVVSGWRPMREAAEAHARTMSDRADVTLAEIYAATDPLLPRSIRIRLSELETESELDVAVATRRGRFLFDRAQAAGKTIVITSDMYLPKTVLERMLTAAGYSGWDRLIVSGADGVSKRDGSAYTSLRAWYVGRSVAHVGDNLGHDVRNAVRAGVRGVLLESPAAYAARWTRYVPTLRRRPSIDVDGLSASLADGLFVVRVEHASSGLNAFEQAGYALLGPCLLGFAEALQQCAIDHGASKLFFLAREGRILQRAYRAAIVAEAQLPSAYALLSSRVTSMAALGSELSSDDLRFLVKTPVPLPARSFLTRVLGPHREADIEESLLRHGIPPDRRLDQGEALAALTPVFRGWAPDLSHVATTQRGLLAKYLRSIGLLSVDETPMLVDVGWSGTIQRALATVRGADLEGFYLGLLDDRRTRSTTGLHAWIDARRGAAEATELGAIFEGLRVLEVLFAASDEGSTQSFREADDDQAVPTSVHLGLEFPSWTAALIDRAQDEALGFIADFRQGWDRLSLPAGTPVGALGRDSLLELMTWPTAAQLDDFATLPFDGSYGEQPGSVGPWGVPGTLAATLHPHRVARGLRRRTARFTRLLPRRRSGDAADTPGGEAAGRDN